MAYYRPDDKDWSRLPEAEAARKLSLKQIKDMAYEPGSATVQRYGWKNLLRELIRRLEEHNG